MFRLIKQIALNNVILRDIAGNGNRCRAVGRLGDGDSTAGYHFFLGIVGIDTHHKVSIFFDKILHRSCIAVHFDVYDTVV